MITENTVSCHFEEYIENTAIDILTDKEYDDFQGLFILDKIRYLANHGSNVIPIAYINGYIC